MQPAAYLALLSLSGGLPAFQFQPERAAALIEQLDAHRFAQREQAAKELVHMGLPAVPLLKKAAQSAPNVEVSERIEHLIRDIRYRAFSGGPVNYGLQATLRPEADVFSPGEKIVLSLEIANASTQIVSVLPPNSWGLCQDEDFIEFLSRPCDGYIRLRALSGQKLPQRHLMIGDKRDRVVENLRRGQSVVSPVVLTKSADEVLAPGEYEVQLLIHQCPLKLTGLEPLCSNKVRFTIAGKTK
jgi:hypothetical protein